MRERVVTGLYAGVLFVVLGSLAWATGRAFLFPSLGPSAFVLAFHTRETRAPAGRIVGAHTIGALAGFLAHSLFASGVVITGALAPFDPAGLRLAASAIVSIVLTSWGMLGTEAIHAPACATTLIVSLGLLSTPSEVGLIVVSVVLLVAVHTGAVRAARRRPNAGFLSTR
ncbi:HPP family protein [Natronomonas sp. EA1]|uniref:HPP family protein n=1 Tax=Natronomonas sp. EA1 TaxID=3421655 RepID=UPI003EB7F5F6